MQNQAIFLMGPTAVGKTALAVQLAQRLPVDLISVDSAMVYVGLDIGTGKSTPAELASTPQQLIDICEPNQAYSVAQFCLDARAAMQRSWQQQRIPLLVGGTMLYFKALQFGLAELPAADAELRNKLAQQATELGWPAMHAQLAILDPVTAQRLSINDSQRIQRALEINILTGESVNSSYARQSLNTLDYKLHSFALLPTSREDLHAVIAQRFMHMLNLGFETEVRNLYNRGDLHAQLPAIRSVGYRQMWQYLNNEINYAVMTHKTIVATRQLAKRQLTWLRSWPDVVNINNSAALDTIIHSVLDSSNY